MSDTTPFKKFSRFSNNEVTQPTTAPRLLNKDQSINTGSDYLYDQNPPKRTSTLQPPSKHLVPIKRKPIVLSPRSP